MEFIVIALLVVIVIGFIAYPLFSGSAEKTAPTANALDSLIAQRDSAYDAIRDLDFDYQLGKLSQSDYAALREKYRARAALALQQIDQLAGSDGADARIEEEVTRLREQRARPAAGDAIEQEVARLRERRTQAANGSEVEQEVARLRARRHGAGNRCPNCGTPYAPGDRFCAKCGSKLPG